jgi:hypothetical protein
MTTFTTFSNEVLPSDNRFSDCKALYPLSRNDSGKVSTLETTKLHFITSGETNRSGRRILAVLGPMACHLCDHQCKDAVLTLSEEQQVDMVVTSMNPSLRHDSELRELTTVLPDQKPEAAYDQPIVPPTLPGGWSHKQVMSIVDDSISLHAGAVLSVSPEGQLAIHDESFQAELTIPTTTADAPIQTLEELASGQQLLF